MRSISLLTRNTSGLRSSEGGTHSRFRFAPVALTIVFALGASLLLSLTLVPVLASLLLKESAHHEPWLMRKLDRAYRPMLELALARPKVAGAMAAAALLLGAVADLEYRGDEVHHHGGEELAGVMQLRPVNIADEKSEIERAGEDDDESENDFFKVHGKTPAQGSGVGRWYPQFFGFGRPRSGAPGRITRSSIPRRKTAAWRATRPDPAKSD